MNTECDRRTNAFGRFPRATESQHHIHVEGRCDVLDLVSRRIPDALFVGVESEATARKSPSSGSAGGLPRRASTGAGAEPGPRCGSSSRRMNSTSSAQLSARIVYAWLSDREEISDGSASGGGMRAYLMSSGMIVFSVLEC